MTPEQAVDKVYAATGVLLGTDKAPHIASYMTVMETRIEELEGKMRQILEWHPTITTAPRRRISEIREIAKSALTGGKKDE